MVMGNIWKKGAQLFPFVGLDTGMASQMTRAYQLRTNSLCQRNNGALRGITNLNGKLSQNVAGEAGKGRFNYWILKQQSPGNLSLFKYQVSVPKFTFVSKYNDFYFCEHVPFFLKQLN